MIFTAYNLKQVNIKERKEWKTCSKKTVYLKPIPFKVRIKNCREFQNIKGNLLQEYSKVWCILNTGYQDDFRYMIIQMSILF